MASLGRTERFATLSKAQLGRVPTKEVVQLSEYYQWRGCRTGATMWRSVATGGQAHVFPDGVMDLMWYGDRLVIAGADSVTMRVSTSSGGSTWGLRLPPGAGHALLGVPARELTNQRIGLEDLAPIPDVVSTTGERDIPSMLEQAFVALWRRAMPDSSVLRSAASIDRAARGCRSVREIAAEHGMSERGLRRAADRLFGYGVTTLIDIHRFQHALHLAHSGTALSEVAALAGYYDQPHLNRATRRLTGATPRVAFA